MDIERKLNELVGRLKAAAGANLKAVVLYGSAAGGDFQPEHSDLNVLCLLDRASTSEFEELNSAVSWWHRQGNPAPFVFTLDELRRSADVFAIELLDIKAQHRMLFGPDVLAELDVPTKLHHLQVERELRTNWIRLREAVLTAPRKRRALEKLMTGSISTFVALFRHALTALGQSLPGGKRAIVDCAAALSGASPTAFHAVLDLREGKRRGLEDAEATLRGYLDLVERVTDEVDRRLAARQCSEAY